MARFAWCRGLWILPVALLLSAPLTVHAFQFCGGPPPTILSEIKEADAVVCCKFGAPRPIAGTTSDERVTDLHIEAVLKDHRLIHGRTVITLPRKFKPEKDVTRILVFCAAKGELDPYRGILVKRQSDLVTYAKGCIAVRNKSRADQLRFFLSYLHSADGEIADDALREWQGADYQPFREVCEALQPQQVVQWLSAVEPHTAHCGLFARMLGHCGTEKHARLLRKILDWGAKRWEYNLADVMVGYSLLSPRDGWAYISGILTNGDQPFGRRSAALRAVQFFWEFRPDVVAPHDLLKGVCRLFDQNDMADLAVIQLRAWQRWELRERVLALYDRKTPSLRLIRRAVLGYAFCCRNDPKVAVFLETQRRADPELVADVQAYLEGEGVVLPPPHGQPQ